MIVKQSMAVMKYLALLILLAPAAPAEGFAPYLGLAMPYPVSVPALHMERLTSGNPGSIDVDALLKINADGEIKTIEIPEANREVCGRFVDDIRKIELAFLAGMEIGAEINIPIKLYFIDRKEQGTDVRIKFPLDSAGVADYDLLYALFRANNIEPPAIIEAPDINYTPPENDSSRVDISTALVTIDSAGRVDKVEFPIENQRRIKHQTLTALIYATITPFKISGQARPAQFLVTFRYFDELNYPLNPVTGYAADSLKPYAFEYFMNIYFNFDDIANPALPRNYPAGFMRPASLGRQLSGEFSANIRIDPAGNIQAISIPNVDKEDYKLVHKCVGLFDWYPAFDNTGNPIWFYGQMKLEFNGTPLVVYIPEWLE